MYKFAVEQAVTALYSEQVKNLSHETIKRERNEGIIVKLLISVWGSSHPQDHKVLEFTLLASQYMVQLP